VAEQQPAEKRARGPAGAAPGGAPRELALQGVYEWLVGGQDLAAVEGHLMESDGFDKADRQHLREVLARVIDGADSLRAQFVEFIDRRPEQLSPVEHGILLIAPTSCSSARRFPTAS